MSINEYESPKIDVISIEPDENIMGNGFLGETNNSNGTPGASQGVETR